MMRVGRVVVLGVLLCWCLGGTRAGAEVIRVSAAASLTEVFKELGEVYASQHPGVELQFNMASSGALARQLEAGAPSDLYVSANPKWMDYLQQQGVIASDAARVLVCNSLVFVGIPPGATSLAGLASLGRVALGSPKSVPAGRYAEQALTAAGLYAQLLAAQQLVLAKDVRQALLYAEHGEVDGAFVYRTDALLAQAATILFVVPPELYPAIEYPAALTRAGEKHPAAAAFLDYLYGPEAQPVFLRHGFTLPGKGA